jgi:DNA-binding CsgD family transcriptional regulator/tetratricopeptide (TPR) repeat protein
MAAPTAGREANVHASTTVVGREHELEAVERFIRGLRSGPSSFVLDGAAGIGKTAIWTEAIRTAEQAGTDVRSCRCGEADASWTFAGLGDLLDGISPAITAALPDVQRRALSAAMLTAEPALGPSVDRVLAVAVLGVLRACAAERPVLLAVDDVQWLDAGTRRVLSFALLRLRDEPVGLLTSCRTGVLGQLGNDADLGLPGQRLQVGPVNLSTAARIVSTRLDITLSRPTLTRLHQATGGNPMVCLEMARALQRRGGEPGADEPLPVPADLRSLVTDRLAGLSPAARRLLMLISAMAQPSVESVAAATGEPADVSGSLAEVLAAGVVELDGSRLRFTHPLLASIPYADLLPAERRRLHEHLALTVTDPEEHARHAALGSTGPDAGVADALARAARHARRRGSLEAAAELAELAISRTPLGCDADLLSRRVDAAEYVFRMGDLPRARALLIAALDAAGPGPSRVAGLLLLATIMSWEDGDEQVAQVCEQALVEAGDDVLLQARCHATFAETGPSGPAVDLFHARAAVSLLEDMESPPSDLLSNALSNVALHGQRLGNGLAVEILERAEALQTVEGRPGIFERAAMALGMGLKHVDRFDDSRTWLLSLHTSAVDEGDDSALPMILGQLALLECWAGAYDLALTYAVRGREVAEQVGIKLPALASAHVLTLAHLGRLTEARAMGEADRAAHEAAGYLSAAPLHLRSLGFIDLAEGKMAAAAEKYLLALKIAHDIGTKEPAMMRLHQDAVAALVSIGDIEQAERLTGELDASSQALGLPWATAMAGRCHGLLYAAAGDMSSATKVLEQSLVAHALLPMPFERARTRLLLGTVLRRSGRRSDARRELEAARSEFVRLGTPVQADQASEALSGLGGNADGAGQGLTLGEGRVAALVAAGQTNREVAETLFMSVRTVESHLSRIYNKLGLRSRTELSRKLPTQDQPTGD